MIEGWSRTKFSTMLEHESISYGIVQPGPHVLNNYVPIIRVQNIKNGQIDVSDLKHVSKGIEAKYQRTRLVGGELLITVVGSVGECAIVPQSLVGFNVARAVSVARITSEYSKQFVKYAFSTNDIVFQMYGNINDTVQATLNLKELKSLQFLTPPLPEQKAIAGVLSSLDDKIDLLHRQNKILEGLAETLFRQTIETSEVEWMPLKNILASIESGKRPKGGIDPNLAVGVPSIGAESINGFEPYNYKKVKYISRDFFESMNRGKVRDYDVLIYKDGAYIGKKSLFGNGYPYEECAINEHVFILRTGDVTKQLFLYFSLDQRELAMLNSNSAQPGLNQTAMKGFEILWPSEGVIREFSSQTRLYIDKIFSNFQQIQTLEKLRDTLLPKLMSGEVRVDYDLEVTL